MTKTILYPTNKPLQGLYEPPADKSLTHRAVLFAALSNESSVIHRPLLAQDCLSTIRCLRALGVPIQVSSKQIRVKAAPIKTAVLRVFSAPKKRLDCGNSGTTARLLSGILAAQPMSSELFGDASLSQRPMNRVMEPLRQMGAMLQAKKNSFLPMKIHGNAKLRSIRWKNPVASAQVKSALLLAGLFAEGKTQVQEPARSRDHTERLLKHMGAPVEFRRDGNLSSKNTVRIHAPRHLRGLDFTVPGDFSSAAFFIVAALLVPGSHLKIKNVSLNPTRSGLFRVLKRMGAKIHIQHFHAHCGEPMGDLAVEYSAHLRATSVGGGEIPALIDEVPILAVLATQAKGTTVIRGAKELRVKESDRLRAMAESLKKMGAKVVELSDGLKISGPTPLVGAKVRSYHDHRIAMSFAVAALIANGATEIEDPDCVKISYPQFFRDLKRVCCKSKDRC